MFLLAGAAGIAPLLASGVVGDRCTSSKTKAPSFEDALAGRGGRNRTYADGFGDRCTTIIRRPHGLCLFSGRLYLKSFQKSRLKDLRASRFSFYLSNILERGIFIFHVKIPLLSYVLPALAEPRSKLPQESEAIFRWDDGIFLRHL